MQIIYTYTCTERYIYNNTYTLRYIGSEDARIFRGKYQPCTLHGHSLASLSLNGIVQELKDPNIWVSDVQHHHYIAYIYIYMPALWGM